MTLAVLDGAVSDILAALDDKGLSENAIIVFA
jgi:arylsulfatase A-like enzyme